MSDYHAWEASECEHFTDVNVTEKTVICKRKPVRESPLLLGYFLMVLGIMRLIPRIAFWSPVLILMLE
jgi:hypothetical protein